MQHSSRVELRLFHTTEPLSFVAFDLLGLLLKSKYYNVHVIVVTDCFIKLTGVIPLKYTTFRAVKNVFLQYREYAYSISDCLLSDDGPQFTARYL